MTPWTVLGLLMWVGLLVSTPVLGLAAFALALALFLADGRP